MHCVLSCVPRKDTAPRPDQGLEFQDLDGSDSSDSGLGSILD